MKRQAAKIQEMDRIEQDIMREEQALDVVQAAIIGLRHRIEYLECEARVHQDRIDSWSARVESLEAQP